MIKGGGAMMGQLLKQMEKMQDNVKKMQDDLAKAEITGQSGGGMVSIVITGAYEVKRVKIEGDLLQEDKEMVEDLIAAAFNDAIDKLQNTLQDQYSKLGGGMGLPPGFKLPF